MELRHLFFLVCVVSLLSTPVWGETQVGITADKEFAYTGQAVTFTADVAGNYTWTITPAGGSPEEASDDATHTVRFSDPGSYTITVTGDGSGSLTPYAVVPRPPAKNDPINATLTPGWNTLSTPLPLATPAIGAFLPGTVSIALAWDTAEAKWVILDGAYDLAPLDAIFLYSTASGVSDVTLTPAYEYGDSASRSFAAGVTLFGYIVPYDGTSLGAWATSPDLGTLTYTYIVSANAGDEWVRYTPLTDVPPFAVTKGYWMYVTTPGDLDIYYE